MTYTIEYVERVFSSAEEAAEYITENMDDEAFDEMLDECYPTVTICGINYSPSMTLYRVDETAYNCFKNDYYNSLASDIVYELERMDTGEEQEFYGYTVTAYDEDEDDYNEMEDEDE